jgi:CCR4-NOT transcriptional regulation complex NOT5 subunit
MRHTIGMIGRTFPLVLAASALLSFGVYAQDPAAPSVAEAAKRAREAKQGAANKPAKVITDDTLHPNSNNSPSVPNESGTQAGDTSASGAPAGVNQAGANAPAAPASEQTEEKKKELDSVKQQLVEKQNEVDLAQRELALANDNYYSKADYASDKSGKAKLDGMQTDLNAKKDELAQIKAKFAELGGVEEPAKAPGPAAPGKAPATNP